LLSIFSMFILFVLNFNHVGVCLVNVKKCAINHKGIHVYNNFSGRIVYILNFNRDGNYNESTQKTD